MYFLFFHKNLKAHDMGFVLLNFSSKELSNIKHLKFATMLTWLNSLDVDLSSILVYENAGSNLEMDNKYFKKKDCKAIHGGHEVEI